MLHALLGTLILSSSLSSCSQLCLGKAGNSRAFYTVEFIVGGFVRTHTVQHAALTLSIVTI